MDEMANRELDYANIEGDIAVFPRMSLTLNKLIRYVSEIIHIYKLTTHI